jgi:hypothetical protein
LLQQAQVVGVSPAFNELASLDAVNLHPCQTDLLTRRGECP